MNLLAISCLSASHAAYVSVRMEPVVMMLDHASCAAASIAIEADVKALVQKKIVDSGDYWQERATADRKCSGDNVRTVNRNIVRLAK